MRIHSRSSHANTLIQFRGTWDGEISSGKGGINTNLISQPLTMSGQRYLRLFYQERRTVSLSWYTGLGGRSGLIISWDPLTGKYTTWLLSEHNSGSSGGRATGGTLETAHLYRSRLWGFGVDWPSQVTAPTTFEFSRIMLLPCDKPSPPLI